MRLMSDVATDAFLPLVLTTSEFAFLVRMHPETVREKIRNREIVSRGRPARISNLELLKFGVSNFQRRTTLV